jgi:hypothetical protein
MTGKNRRPQPPVVTQAQLERAKRALQRDGTPFAGYRVWPDGHVDVLAGEPAAAAAVNELDAQLEDFKQRHGY